MEKLPDYLKRLCRKRPQVIEIFGVVICDRLNYIIGFGELGAILGRSSNLSVDRMS